jgi:hypothetical protein
MGTHTTKKRNPRVSAYTNAVLRYAITKGTRYYYAAGLLPAFTERVPLSGKNAIEEKQ